MDRLQFLLVKLAEEASEVAKISLKAAQFGLEEQCPDLKLNNKERIHEELDDLHAIVCMLNEEFKFNFKPNGEAMIHKISKVNRYYKYSTGLGMIREEK